MRFTPFLLPSRSGNLGRIELNNPKALNALNPDMVNCLNDVFSSWKKDNTLRAILMTGNNNDSFRRKAFCAGGDVKTVYEAGKGLLGELDKVAFHQKQHGYGETGLLTADFFREEYKMNYKIATQNPNVPQISLWDGVVMGGGVGVSIHGKYRVATENTLFAMPETAIGLFPDVGGMFWLPRLNGGLGPYIALTGARLKADDLLYAGIATHYVPSKRLDELQQAILDATYIGNTDDEVGSDEENGETYYGYDPNKDYQTNKDNISSSTGDMVVGTLMSFHEEITQKDSYLSMNRKEIDKAFHNKTSVEDIMDCLEQLDSEFSKRTLYILGKMSPTSLKVTLEGLKRGKSMETIEEVLKMENRVSQTFMRDGSDFYEGIRALLVDKDKNPQWNPKKLSDVIDATVQSHFTSLGENELVLEKLDDLDSKL